MECSDAVILAIVRTAAKLGGSFGMIGLEAIVLA